MSEPDYTTMSGAEFKREVGADPEKWAVEFQKAANALRHTEGLDVETERTAFIAAWFRDAMAAAVNAADPQYLGDDFEKAFAKEIADIVRQRLSELDLERATLARRVSGKPRK